MGPNTLSGINTRKFMLICILCSNLLGEHCFAPSICYWAILLILLHVCHSIVLIQFVAISIRDSKLVPIIQSPMTKNVWCPTQIKTVQSPEPMQCLLFLFNIIDLEFTLYLFLFKIFDLWSIRKFSFSWCLSGGNILIFLSAWPSHLQWHKCPPCSPPIMSTNYLN